MSRYLIRQGTYVILRTDILQDKANEGFICQRDVVFNEDDIYEQNSLSFVFTLPKNDRLIEGLFVLRSSILILTDKK